VTILAGAFVLLLVLVVGLGRVAHGRQLVAGVAGTAARAASMESTGASADTAARQAAQDALSEAGVSCTALDVTVDTGQFHAGGQVTVTVACTAELADLAMSGLPGSSTVSSSATVPLENFRSFGDAP
jgi:Flp pilus assembly protein TadG